MKKKPVIADYDASHYDYETYWQGRGYEDLADKLALKRLLAIQKLPKHNIYIDIGGAFGREVETYARYVDQIILFDYSLELLKKGKQYLDQKRITNVTYIAGNLYYLPFKDRSITAGQMIRVMHHIRFAKKAFTEIARVINYFFILEVANKIHFKARIRAIAQHQKNYVKNTEPIQQTFRSTSQGSSGEDQIFLNFHPAYITNIASEAGFRVSKELSVSNLRFPFLKKIFPASLLLQIEKMLQTPLAKSHFGPSSYFLLTKRKVKKNIYKPVEEILCCPVCKGELEKQKEYICTNCHMKFPIISGILDFRYQEE